MKLPEAFRYQSGELVCEELPLRKVLKEVGSPTYVYSANFFRNQLKTLQSELREIPAVICYAVKANSNLSILSLMVEEGAGLDLVSGGELERARRVGCPADRLVFSGVGKTRQEMAQGLQYPSKGIRSFHVESIAELATLSEVAEALGKRAQVTLRFNPDVDAKTHPYISTGLKKNKFGLTHDEVLGIAKSLDGFPMIDLCGLSIHIGSQILDLAPLSEAFEKCVEMVHQLNPHLSIPLRWADFGGGLGVTYRDEKAPSIRDYARAIKKAYKKLPLFNRQRGTPMELFLEPGRILSAQGGALITQILYRKSRAKKDFLIVDAAMNDLMRPSLYGSYHEVVPLNSASRVDAPVSLRRSKSTDLVGPVCETGDTLAEDRPLPLFLNQGDALAILSAGAYGMSMASRYNSRPLPAEVLVDGRKFEIIRSRETFDEMLLSENFQRKKKK